MSIGEDPKAKQIAKIIQEAGTPAVKKPRKPRKINTDQPLEPKQGVIYVAGSGNVVAGGDVTNNVTHNYNHKPTNPRPVVKTGDGVIDGEQKGELLRLRDEWIATHNAVKATPLTQGAAMSKLNRHMGVNTYHEIPMERFGEARAWMMQQPAIIRNMKSAPAKAPNWRSKTITYIKTRCKNQLGDAQIYKPYIETKFGKSSLALLSDVELQTVKQHVAQKQPS